MDFSNLILSPVWTEGDAYGNETLVLSNPLPVKGTDRQEFMWILFKRDDFDGHRWWLGLVFGSGALTRHAEIDAWFLKAHPTALRVPPQQSAPATHPAATVPATPNAAAVPTAIPSTTPTSKATTPPFSDADIDAFAAKIDSLKYPTSIADACKTLGINRARLFAPDIPWHIDAGSPASSQETMSTALSPKWWIALDISLDPSSSGVTKITIFQPYPGTKTPATALLPLSDDQARQLAAKAQD